MPRGDQTETEKGARAYSNRGSDFGGYVLACSRAWAGILTSSSAHLQSQAQLAFLSGFGSQPVSHTSRGAHSITTQAGKPVHSPVQVLSIASTSFNFPLIRKLVQVSYPHPSQRRERKQELQFHGLQNKNQNHRKLTKMITWITALSNSMKL